jgi:DNA-binding NtrC family response regulator
MRILYLENHADFARNVTSIFLTEHEVTVVPSLAEARLALVTRVFDLVLSDYDVDDGKGSVFVNECRTAWPRMPIIAASSHDAGNEALMRAGASAICDKMSFARIGEVISAVVQEHRGGSFQESPTKEGDR